MTNDYHHTSSPSAKSRSSIVFIFSFLTLEAVGRVVYLELRAACNILQRTELGIWLKEGKH